ncbi:MAG TPA: dephospho-CoA kinase [Oscillospiraceae bacterium]|nr:dephospho-CoA kinase [Oscillospiraceae bacterium]
MDKPVIIGLTGPTGAGKSTVAADLAQQGCDVIDCDRVAREVTSGCTECIAQLCAEFGDDIVNEQGGLNRHLLAQRAFANKQKSNKLNQITHPFILDKIKNEITALQSKNVTAIVVDAPVLFESGVDSFCNVILVVIAPLDVRLNRIMTRDNISRELALKRINVQHSDDFYTRRADYCIDGASGLEQISKQVKDILNRIVGDTYETT